MSGLTISHGGSTLTLTKKDIEDRLRYGLYERLRNNFEGESVEQIFKIINAADSVKDGISTKLSQEIYSPVQDDVNADIIKTHMKHRLDKLIESREARRTMYHRVKGTKESDYVSNISCTKALLDCGAHPDKILRKNVRTPLISTIGSFIDTGPSETTLDHTFPETCDISEEIMSLLGYDDSSIKRYGDSFVMKLAGISYPTTLDTTGINIKKELALGNKNKNALIKLSSTPIERKRALVYYKSLGDKSLAFFYMLYWLYLEKIRSSEIPCLFTCDMFTSLYCLVFGVSFVFNTNEFENGAKVTGVYHWTPEPVDWRDLIEKQHAIIIEEYNRQIRLLHAMKGKDIYFTGDVNVYSNSGKFIQLLIDKMNEFLGKVDVFISSKPSGYEFTESDNELLKQYKPIILFNVNKDNQNMFVTTKKRVCVADGGNIVSNNKNLRDICISITDPAGGGKAAKHKKTDKRKNKSIPRAVLVGGTSNHIGYNFELDDAIKDLEVRCNSIYYGIIRELGVPDFFDDYVIPNDSLDSAKDLFPTEVHSDYDYGSIYDEVTYYLYAKPDYSDANLFSVITTILKNYVDDKVQLYQAAAIVANERVLKAQHSARENELISIENYRKAKRLDDILSKPHDALPPPAFPDAAAFFDHASAVSAAKYDESASKYMDAAYAHQRTAHDNEKALDEMIAKRDSFVALDVQPAFNAASGQSNAMDAGSSDEEFRGNLIDPLSQSQPEHMDTYPTGNFVPNSPMQNDGDSQGEVNSPMQNDGDSQGEVNSPESLSSFLEPKHNPRGVNRMGRIDEMETGGAGSKKTRMTNKKRKCTKRCQIKKVKQSKKARKNKNKKTRKRR